MTVLDTHSVDAMGFDQTGGVFVMTIVDHLEWEHEPEHLGVLQNKLNAYLEFVLGGQAAQNYPDADAELFSTFRVDVKFQHDPPQHAWEILAVIQEKLAEYGALLQCEVVGHRE